VHQLAAPHMCCRLLLTNPLLLLPCPSLPLQADAVQSAVLAVDAAARELWPHSRVALFGSQASQAGLHGGATVLPYRLCVTYRCGSFVQLLGPLHPAAPQHHLQAGLPG